MTKKALFLCQRLKSGFELEAAIWHLVGLYGSFAGYCFGILELRPIYWGYCDYGIYDPGRISCYIAWTLASRYIHAVLVYGGNPGVSKRSANAIRVRFVTRIPTWIGSRCGVAPALSQVSVSRYKSYLTTCRTCDHK